MDLPDVKKALSSKWFDTIMPEFNPLDRSFLCQSDWAEVAMYRLQHGQETEADAILLNGLAAGFPIAVSYRELFFKRMTFEAAAMVVSKAEQQPLTKALLLHACCVR